MQIVIYNKHNKLDKLIDSKNFTNGEFIKIMWFYANHEDYSYWEYTF